MIKSIAQTCRLPIIMTAKNADVIRMNKDIQKTNSITHLIKLLLLFGVVIFYLGCTQNNNQKTNLKIVNDTFVTPHITFLANLADSNKPVKLLLVNAPKPVTITVPVKYKTDYIAHSASGSKTDHLSTPVTHSFFDTITNLPIAADAQGRGFFTTYNTDNGLALDQVYCSYKDRKGNLWFGTNGGGVSKYDGKSFTNYTTAQGLTDNVVWSIVEDKVGNLWFGTIGRGVSKYDGESFTNYTTAQGLPNNVIWSIAEDKLGNLWFGTDGSGVSKYDGKSFTNYTTAQGLAGNIVRCIMEDKAGNLWFGTDENGISKYDGKAFTNYTTTEGLSNNAVRSMIQDKQGNYWFGTQGGGLSKYDGINFVTYTTAQGLANNVVRDIAEDKTGNIWIGTDGGVSKYDNNYFTNYNTAQGLVNNVVRSITEDEKGNLWFGTFGGGISKYAGKSFTNFTIVQGLANNIIWTVADDNTGNLWFGTNGGASKYDGKSFTNYTTVQGLPNNVIHCIAKDNKGNLWLGSSQGGVSKYDGKSFTNYTTAQGLAYNDIFCITEDKAGNLWFGGAGGGVSKYDGNSFTNYTTVQGLASNTIYSITEDKKGNLWFGSLGGGVSKFDGKSFTNYTTAQGLANNTVWVITEDKLGNLWFGTQAGLNLLRNKTLDSIVDITKETFTGKLFETFTTKDGLPDNFITQVVPVNDQKLYIGTNLGIGELIHQNLNDGIGKKWAVGKIFNSLTGYPVKDVNAGPGAMFKDGKGVFWIGTGSDRTGLVRFDPGAIINENLTPPEIVLESIKINNENICWNDLITKRDGKHADGNAAATALNITEEVTTFGRQLSSVERDSMREKFGTISFDGIIKWHPIPEKLVLPHRYNDINFDFNAIETGRNFLVKYQYILEGYDKGWSPASNKNFASFGNMYEGDYTFKVKAQSPEGVWSKPITYSFKVLPPWWRTWWMYLGYILLATVLILFFVRWNNRRIIYQKKILEHKVAAATIEIREEKEKVEVQKKQIEETLHELKGTQAQLIQSEKMASLGELTAGIAHEIQNPLNFVNNFSEVSNELIEELKNEKLKPKSERDELLEDEILNDITQNLQKINHHGKRADAIVKGMLQHSRSNSGIKEPTNINKLADEYLRLSYHGLRAKDNSFNAMFKTDFDETIGEINIVPQDICRVLLNLFNNAFYSVAEKKKQIDADLPARQTVYEPTVTVATKKLADKILISVRDNGPGIPQKIIDKIFQPFFTTKPTGQGTGLGLSLSYDIVKAHGGEIKVETKKSEGSEFIILLPVV